MQDSLLYRPYGVSQVEEFEPEDTRSSAVVPQPYKSTNGQEDRK